MFALTSLVTVIALIVYFVMVINVGRARNKYGVKLPQTTGNPDFERVLRVQQNTVEQIVLFLPALWLFAYYISPLWGAVLGAVWVVGRILYAWGYYQSVEKRLPGFAISSFSTMVLIIGSLIGVILNLLKS
ncbi:MAPEG family protein [Merismopedia glauca]|uniref:MAPEG domain-containing protein n=1 Tax=Merismopedia glauca CCAP 1448/3 TaxID=1296344 RepID=A0A2T1C375_9CYAN|nr:MAPEG family protein [Merismopedia glauca]PSB02725.1 MAPEG domain-containing protein [Merismopedia glauca CCAP 1448/3]